VVDKNQVGAAIIAMALLMMASPFALSKALTTTTTYSLGLSSILIFYSLIILIIGVAVFYVKPVEEMQQGVPS